MPAENPFNPEDENVQIMNFEDLVGRMTPERRAVIAAETEAQQAEQPLIDARANIQSRKRQAVLAVKERGRSARQEQKNNNEFFCQEVAAALDKGDFGKLELFVGQKLSEETAFEKPVDLSAIQKFFDRVASVTGDQEIAGELPVEKIRMRTVYQKVLMADKTTRPVAITVKADFSFGKDRPVVSFTISEIPSVSKPKVEAAVPLKSVENIVASQSPTQSVGQRLLNSVKGLFGGKK